MVNPQMNGERWRQFSLAQQMGNIGSELARARSWEKRKDQVQRIRALERAMDLIELTMEDARWRRGVRELARFREVVAAWYCSSAEYRISPEELVDYCINFSAH